MRFILAIWMVLSLSACGQTGDLYWPEAERSAVDEEEVDPDSR